MPLITAHLLSLTPSTTTKAFTKALSSAKIKPLVLARCIRWIILPQTLSTPALLGQNIHWDILLVLPSNITLPSSLTHLISHHFYIQAGMPSSHFNDFATKNQKLLRPNAKDIPGLKGKKEPTKKAESAQGLELNDELCDWISRYAKTEHGNGAVSMLNLISFEPGMRASYLKYGEEFSSSVGSSRGGFAKVVGKVVPSGTEKLDEGSVGEEGKLRNFDAGNDGWDEITLAHYPSIKHFEEMLATEEYQAVNVRYRRPALRDTCILCTCELGLDFDEGMGERAKL